MDHSKPKYELKDYHILLKNLSLTKGLSSGFEMVFSENQNQKDFYNFIIFLPFNNKFFITEIEHQKFILSDGKLPLHISDTDYVGGIYNAITNKYVYPRICLEKYSRDTNNLIYRSQMMEFNNFQFDFIDFDYSQNKITLRAELKASSNLSSREYGVPYSIIATIEIIDEELYVTYVD
ncbi:MAG: hypothetical protein N2490_04865 [Ignavibacteria bacterium]|nr:hypothetical protein [Ignavibacteria bacterium]